MKLYRLGAEAQHLVTRELASGAIARLSEVTYSQFIEETEVPIELDAFDAVAEDLLRSTVRHDTGFDRVAAPALHRALPLSRREAALPGVWRYLAVVHRPELVRHRWEDRSWATTRTRYWALGTRPDSNAFYRLWWIAELTRDGDSYTLTEDVLDRQPLATQIFIRQFSHYRPAVVAFMQVMQDAASPDIERVAKELYGRLSTLILESMSADELQTLIRELAA